MSSSKGQSSTSGREATRFGLDYPKHKADKMSKKGKDAREKRNVFDKGIRLPEDDEDDLMTRAAESSIKARKK